MPDETYPEQITLGKIAFDAYKQRVGGKTVQGHDIPDWEDLGEVVQSGWEAAGEAVENEVLELSD